MKIVKQVLKSRGAQIWSVTPDSSVLDALKLMEEKDIESLLVVEGERLMGIIAESDFTRKVALQGKVPSSIRVKEIMSRQVVTATVNQSCDECIAIMIRNKINSLPVMDGQKVIGVLSMNDAVDAMMYHQKDTIRFLEDMLLMDMETV